MFLPRVHLATDGGDRVGGAVGVIRGVGVGRHDRDRTRGADGTERANRLMNRRSERSSAVRIGSDGANAVDVELRKTTNVLRATSCLTQ